MPLANNSASNREGKMAKVLDGIRMLDVSTWHNGTAGGYMLADLGAEVVKVEPPAGDPYRTFESALGGAYALSRPCLEAIGRAGYLSRHPQGERIAEDVTFSLFVRSLGYEIHEFGGREQPLALAWRGLPMAKEEVIARQKKVVHSVKFQIHDLRVRGYFERIRRQRMRRIEPAADGRSTRRALPTPAGVRRLRVGLLCRRPISRTSLIGSKHLSMSTV